MKKKKRMKEIFYIESLISLIGRTKFWKKKCFILLMRC